ncbi:MAG: hypothetical protein WCK65_11765 [Rhodospirillaceae bacterium]
MEMIVYTVLAGSLYLLADRIVDLIEVRAGRRFQYRTVLFFGILSSLALALFTAIRQFE